MVCHTQDASIQKARLRPYLLMECLQKAHLVCSGLEAAQREPDNKVCLLPHGLWLRSLALSALGGVSRAATCKAKLSLSKVVMYSSPCRLHDSICSGTPQQTIWLGHVASQPATAGPCKHISIFCCRTPPYACGMVHAAWSSRGPAWLPAARCQPSPCAGNRGQCRPAGLRPE